MAFTRIQGAQSTENSTPVSTKAVTLSAIGSGNCVLGAINYDLTGSVTVTSIDDDKGNTYNLDGPVDDSPDGGRSYAFSRTNITNAPTVITAHLSASIGFVGIAADEFSGSSTASSDERDGAAHGGQFQATPGTGTDGVTSGNFTTSTNGDLLYGVSFNNGAGNNPASGTGFTAGVAGSFPAYGFLSEYRTQTTAGSGTATTFTAAINTGHTTFLIAIKPAVTTAAVTLGGTAEFYAPNLGPEFGFKPSLAFPPSITVTSPIFATSAFFDVVRLKQPTITVSDIVPRFPLPKLAGDTWFQPTPLKRPMVETPPMLFKPAAAATAFVVEQPFFEPLTLKRPTEFIQGPFKVTSPPLSGTFATSSFFDPNRLLKIPDRLGEAFGIPFPLPNMKMSAFFEPIKLKQPVIDQPPVFPSIVTVALAIVEQPFFDIIRPKQPIINNPDNLPPVRTLPYGSLINWFDPNRPLKIPERLSDVFFAARFPAIQSLSSWFDPLKKILLREAFDWTATGAIQLNTVRYAISDWYLLVKPIGYRALLSIETPQLFFFPAVTPTIPATYRLLVDHYILNTYLLANTIVTEGTEVPLGWVPTIAAEPLNTTAIQNYWNAGPSGVSSAQYGVDYFSAPFFLGPPTKVGVFWQQIAGTAGAFQLTGAGASLGIKLI